ncbi:unnamed protein product [Chrysoparadoxa australica]
MTPIGAFLAPPITLGGRRPSCLRHLPQGAPAAQLQVQQRGRFLWRVIQSTRQLCVNQISALPWPDLKPQVALAEVFLQRLALMCMVIISLALPLQGGGNLGLSSDLTVHRSIESPSPHHGPAAACSGTKHMRAAALPHPTDVVALKFRRKPRSGQEGDGAVRAGQRRKRGSWAETAADTVVEEAVGLLQEQFVDKRLYSKQDWERLRKEAKEEVLARSLSSRHRVAKPGSAEWGHREVMVLLSKLKDPFTVHLGHHFMDTKLLSNSGAQMGLGCELKREWSTRYVPLALQAAQEKLTGTEELPHRASESTGTAVLTAINRQTFPPAALVVVVVGEMASAVLLKRPPVPVLTLGLVCVGYSSFTSIFRPVVVWNVPLGTAAYTAGLRPGDHVLGIGGESFPKIDVAARNRSFMARGGGKDRLQEGQSVQLRVWRPIESKAAGDSWKGCVRTFTMKPRTMNRSTVEWRMIKPRRNVGYLRISDFSTRTAEEAEDALTELLGQGATSLVLDLRNNAGGSIGAGVDIPSLFLPPGSVVMHIENSDGQVEVVHSYKRGLQCPDVPLAILTNNMSASASEIIVGALKDNGRATVVGQRTYGKGLAQGLFRLRDGSGMAISILRFRSPNGSEIANQVGGSLLVAFRSTHPSGLSDLCGAMCYVSCSSSKTRPHRSTHPTLPPSAKLFQLYYWPPYYWLLYYWPSYY